MDVRGYVRRVHMDDTSCLILLNNENGELHKPTYRLAPDHKNFNPIYSLLLTALANECIIDLGVKLDGETHEVAYAFIDKG